MIIIAALVAGNLLAWNPALRAAETNSPPASSPSTGQPPPGAATRGPGVDRIVDQMAKQLDLNDDQKAKVKPVLETQMQKMRELRTDATVSPEERRPKMLSIREEATAQLKTILTPEQFEKWQATQRNRRPGGPGSPPPGGMRAGGTNAPAASPKE